MSKLNKVSKPQGQKNFGFSENGNLQYMKDANAKLFEFLVSSFYGEDSSKQAEMVQTINASVASGNAAIVANMVRFAKQELGMRTLPIVAAVHLAQACRDWNIKNVSIRQLISDVIVRADELCDAYAYALSIFGDKNKMPLAVKRGVEDAFAKFSEYELAKYNRNGSVTLADLLRVVHPTPAIAEMGRVYRQILDGTLPSPYTWEVEFSRNGQRDPSEQLPKSDLWKQLLESNKLGFLAAIRNIRNMAEAGIDFQSRALLGSLIAKGNSKVLPFQIFQAYKMVPEFLPEVKEALEVAVEKSVENVPIVGDAVWIVTDVSGSMTAPVNMKSKVTMLSTAAQLAATVVKSQLSAGKRVALTLFATTAKTLCFTKNDTVLQIAEKVERAAMSLGGSTALDTAFEQYPEVVKAIGKPDTFMVFSDMQVNDRGMFGWGTNSPYYGSEGVAKLPAFINDIPLKVAVNFRSQETTPLARQLGFVQLSGFSEKIFQLLNVVRNYDKIFARLSAI